MALVIRIPRAAPDRLRPGPTGDPCDGCAVAVRGFCAGLGPSLRARLAQGARPLAAPAGRDLGRDLPSGGLAILVSGVLRTVRYRGDGRRRVIGLSLPGEPVDRPQDPDLLVEAATDARLCRIDRVAHDGLLRGDAAYRRAVGLAETTRLDRLHDLTCSVGVLTPEERLRGFLAFWAQAMPTRPRPEGGLVLSMDLPRTDIADLLDTTVETISRVTRRLAREGTIVILDPWHFAIPDLDALTGHARLRTAVPSPASRGDIGLDAGQ